MDLKQFDHMFIQWTILIVCLVMIAGGLLVFYLRLWKRGQKWRLEYNQVIGTIFFFPTLILLAIYLQMSKEAVVGILGVFLGSLFGRALPSESNAGTNGPMAGNDGTTSPMGTPPANNGERAGAGSSKDESIVESKPDAGTASVHPTRENEKEEAAPVREIDPDDLDRIVAEIRKRFRIGATKAKGF